MKCWGFLFQKRSIWAEMFFRSCDILEGVLDEMSKRRPSLSVCLAVLSWCLTLRWATGRIKKKTKNVVIRFPLVRALSWCVCVSPLRLLEQSWARFVMGILAKPPRETSLNSCCSYIGDAWWEEWDTPTPLWGFFGGVGLVPSLQINSSFSQEQCYDGSHHCLSKLS